MPDGDRFERALRGPWRFPYRIAAGGASPELVATKLADSCFGLLDSELVECARKTLSALDVAIAHSSMPLFYGEAHNTAYQRLCRGLEVISAEHHFDDFAQGCGRAASRCFFQLEGNHQHVGDRQLEHMLAREVLGEIIGRNFFPVVRDKLAQNTGRDAAAQRSWENQVMEALANDIGPFSQALFSTGGKRAPQRITAPASQSFDWSRLNQPLHVLGA